MVMLQVSLPPAEIESTQILDPHKKKNLVAFSSFFFPVMFNSLKNHAVWLQDQFDLSKNFDASVS
jgi:hypothetical protein